MAVKNGKLYKVLDGDSDLKGKLIRALEYTGKGAAISAGVGLEGLLGMQLVQQGQVLLYENTKQVEELDKMDDQTFENLNQSTLDSTSWKELDDLVKHGYLEEVK